MEVLILENEKNLQVIIKCRQINEQIQRLKNHIELFDNKILATMCNGEQLYISRKYVKEFF